MDKATKYDLKEAYNKNLTDKARLHYLENTEHNAHSRKGYAGSYSGSHPRFSSPAGLMGQPQGLAQAQNLQQVPLDSNYNPVAEIPVPTSPTAPIVPAANTAPMAPVAPEQLAAPTYYKKY